MFQTIHTIIYFADDIDAAAAWYAKLLNAKVQYENKLYAFVQGPGCLLGFHPSDEKNSAGQQGSVAYWQVPEIQQAISELTMLGAELYRGPMTTDLNEQAAMLQDPFGNFFGLHQLALEESSEVV